MENSVIYIADSRSMVEVPDESVGLVVTSPPYWQIKDYGQEGQIGCGQSLHEYLYDLARVWQECWRVLKKGRRLCINIGDQFARAKWYGRYKVIPLHAELIAQMEHIGFDYLGAIIWRKKTTLRPSGGAVVMGSFPYPPNGLVEIDYEYILIFKKPGKEPITDPKARELSRLRREEWKAYFTGHWNIGGEKQKGHEAMFPEEVPRRLIRMFSFWGETVLDPFVGSGTTVKVCLELGRRGIGYEIQPAFEPIIRKKLGLEQPGLWSDSVRIEHRINPVSPVPLWCAYRPFVSDIRPTCAPELLAPEIPPTFRISQVLNENTLLLSDQTKVRLYGIIIPPAQREAALAYLRTYLLGKRVFIRPVESASLAEEALPAYIYLPNKLFINRKMIEMGLARADREASHKYRAKFISAESHGQT